MSKFVKNFGQFTRSTHHFIHSFQETKGTGKAELGKKKKNEEGTDGDGHVGKGMKKPNAKPTKLKVE